ncbi:MAG: hypothetical protein Q7T41_02840 [Candidatus Saccharibacteria bacterium]|nr:hypothetical protein [Candidatus Saccharibacteria bacterium]
MKNIKRLLIVMVMAVFAVPLAALAQDSGEQAGSGGISISPTRFELVIERGKAELATIQVKNVTQNEILAKAYLNDFEPDGVTGNPILLVDDTKEQSSSSLRDFIVGLEDVTIPAGETAIVNLPIQVPDNAAPGAYYGAVRFQAAPVESAEQSDQEAQLSLNASVAAIVLVEVPGDITEKIEVSSVGAYVDDKKGSLFTKTPTQVGIKINNLGNGFSKPFGAVSVKGPWGSGEILNYELNDTTPRGNVLPNSARLFLKDLSGVKWPGRYTIEANISHGRGGEVLTAKSSFWYIPSWLIVILIVFLAAIVTLGFYLYKKYITKTTSRRR